MIQVSKSEVKNRLSYYLRLVRGGEQIEILDRNTPLARIIHVSQAGAEDNKTPWIKEMEGLGIVTPPKKKGFPLELLAGEKVVLAQKKAEAAFSKPCWKRGEPGDDILKK